MGEILSAGGGWFEMGDKFVDPSQERDLDDDVSEAQDRAN